MGIDNPDRLVGADIPLGILSDEVSVATRRPPPAFFFLFKTMAGLVGAGSGLGGSGILGIAGALPPKHMIFTPFHFVVGKCPQGVERQIFSLPPPRPPDYSYPDLERYPEKHF